MGSLIACGKRDNGPASLRIAVPTALPLHLRARIREVVEVYTDPEDRGKGHARDLMQRVCTSADFSNTWLMVHVEPGEQAIELQRLAEFYARLGFTPFQATPLLMVRQSVTGRAI